MCNQVLRILKKKTERVLTSKKTMKQISRVRKKKGLSENIKTIPLSLLASIIKASNGKGEIKIEILHGILTYENPSEPGKLRELSNSQFLNLCGIDPVVSKKLKSELKEMEILDVEKMDKITKSGVSQKMEGLAKQLELEEKISFLKI